MKTIIIPSTALPVSHFERQLTYLSTTLTSKITYLPTTLHLAVLRLLTTSPHKHKVDRGISLTNSGQDSIHR